MNPCPCGHHGSRKQACTCRPGLPARYLQRLSGPLLDRIDLQIDVAGIDSEELLASADEAGLAGAASSDRDGNSATENGSGGGSGGSAAVARRVALAHERSIARQQVCYAQLDSRQIEHHCATDAAARNLLHTAARPVVSPHRASSPEGGPHDRRPGRPAKPLQAPHRRAFTTGARCCDDER
jgi:magnesium chelatase family protein